MQDIQRLKVVGMGNSNSKKIEILTKDVIELKQENKDLSKQLVSVEKGLDVKLETAKQERIKAEADLQRIMLEVRKECQDSCKDHEKQMKQIKKGAKEEIKEIMIKFANENKKHQEENRKYQEENKKYQQEMKTFIQNQMRERTRPEVSRSNRSGCNFQQILSPSSSTEDLESMQSLDLAEWTAPAVRMTYY